MIIGNKKHVKLVKEFSIVIKLGKDLPVQKQCDQPLTNIYI